MILLSMENVKIVHVFFKIHTHVLQFLDFGGQKKIGFFFSYIIGQKNIGRVCAV